MRRSAREMSPSLMTSLASGGMLERSFDGWAGALRSGQVTAAGPPSPPHRTVVKGCRSRGSLTCAQPRPDTGPRRGATAYGPEGVVRREPSPRPPDHPEQHEATRVRVASCCSLGVVPCRGVRSCASDDGGLDLG